jgi:hypothetical protein
VAKGIRWFFVCHGSAGVNEFHPCNRIRQRERHIDSWPQQGLEHPCVRPGAGLIEVNGLQECASAIKEADPFDVRGSPFGLAVVIGHFAPIPD